MHEIAEIILIAVALSMDTFSVSLSLGTANIEIKKGILLSTVIGIMHFVMPLLGVFIGNFLLKIVPFKHDYFLGVIFLILAFKMTYDLFIENNEKIDMHFLGIFLFSLGVSFDAFTTGIGLLAITNKIFLSTTIFFLISYLFTLFGILIGKYVNQKIGKVSSIFGIIILIIMSLYLIIWYLYNKI